MPFELKDKLKAKHDKMIEKEEIINRVEEPTRWVNSLVVETKPTGDISVCLDPVYLNKAILREYHPVPVVDDIILDMKDSDLFIKLDLQDGYWHVNGLQVNVLTQAYR